MPAHWRGMPLKKPFRVTILLKTCQRGRDVYY
jgi:hypothetical protein